jgi:hypothetical protein
MINSKRKIFQSVRSTCLVFVLLFIVTLFACAPAAPTANVQQTSTGFSPVNFVVKADLAYTLVSGTNKDFGTRGSWTNAVL